MKQGRRRTRRGFTLIELLTVVLIIGLIAGMVAPRLFKGLGKAKHDIAKSKMARIELALGEFYLHCERLPTNEEGLEALVTMPPELEGKWAGRYCKPSELLDPWGNPYLYFEGSGEIGDKDFELICLGADGAEGGEGDNEDIFND